MKALVKFLVVLLTLTSGLPAKASGELFYVTFDTTGVLHYTGNDPAITPELLDGLRKQAQDAAATLCRSLLGDVTILQKTGESPLEQSILEYSLPMSFLCGREIRTTAEVIPSLIDSLQRLTYEDYELAEQLLLKIGSEAIEPLVAVASDSSVSDDIRERFFTTLGEFLQGKGEVGSERDHLLRNLVILANDRNPMISYYAVNAFAKYYAASYFAREYRNQFTVDAYGLAVYAISNNWKVGSSYEVQLSELQYLLNSSSKGAVNSALYAITLRGLTDAEFTALLADFTAVADPSNPSKDGTVFRILGLHPSEAIAERVVKAIQSRLLDNDQDQSFLFQAMLALDPMVKFPAAKKAMDELLKIASSNVNPQNQYLQVEAKNLLNKIN